MFVETGRPGILVDKSGRARESDGENIGTFVAVEVVDPAEEMIGVAFDRLRFGGKDFLLCGEVRPLEPIGAINRVGDAVAIDIADVRSLGVVYVGQWNDFERVSLILRCPRGASAKQRHCQRENRDRQMASMHRTTPPFSSVDTFPRGSPSIRKRTATGRRRSDRLAVAAPILAAQEAAVPRFGVGLVRRASDGRKRPQ